MIVQTILVIVKKFIIKKKMFKWLVKKWYNHSPICNCGWAMKPFESWTSRYQWKCVWKSCGCEAFQSDNGKLHWFQGKNS